MIEDALVVIPARGGSKGIPRKNIRPLAGKPLVLHSIETALEVVPAANICISTDDEEIIEVAQKSGVTVPFKRPEALATDTASSQDVLVHALDHYAAQGKQFSTLILLQATSPFRKPSHITEAYALYDSSMDMVTSATLSDANPYYNLFELDEEGLAVKSKAGSYTRRQDCPPAYQLNGSVYVINPASLRTKKMSEFDRMKLYFMDPLYSVDLDSEVDWQLAEFLFQQLISKAIS